MDISPGKLSKQSGAELRCNGFLGEEQDSYILQEDYPQQTQLQV